MYYSSTKWLTVSKAFDRFSATRTVRAGYFLIEALDYLGLYDVKCSWDAVTSRKLT